MNVYKALIYNNANIGVFARAWGDFLILPNGYPAEKGRRLAEMLGASPVMASIAGAKLLGPLIVMNSNGALVSKFASDEELEAIRSALGGRRVERFSSRSSAVGNLVLANDHGAVASDRLGPAELSQVRDVLGVDVVRMRIAGYHQVGAVAAANDYGALLHPMASDEEMEAIKGALGLNDVDRGTVNGGVPFVASGLIVNDRAVLVGSSTTGPELFIISKVFKGG